MQSKEGSLSSKEKCIAPDAFQAFADAFGSSTADAAIVRACADLRKHVNDFGPPVGLRKLLGHFNAIVTERPLESAGRLEVQGGRYVVVLKQGTPWRRQRFTLAHEIGHMLLLEALGDRPHYLRELRKHENWEFLERLCNVAAAELLVPRDDLLDFAGSLRRGSDVFRQLYDRYLCSLSVLFIRCVEVFDGLTVSLWKQHARHMAEQKDWRVVRCFRSCESTWMPEGMTARRHLMPNIVRSAAEDGTAREGDLIFDLNRRKRNVCGVSFRLNRRSRIECNDLPIFEGMKVTDEPFGDSHVALLMWPRLSSKDTCKCLANWI